MTNDRKPDRADVWEALADQFLDTETRDAIPFAALTCIEAGLTVAEARDVFRFEVTPALWLNLRDVAGEWAGWSRPWLVGRIERCRGGLLNRPGRLGNLIYRWRAAGIHHFWISIERTMEWLLAQPRERRRPLATDLAWLARRALALGQWEEPVDLTTERREELSHLYRDVFPSLLGPALAVGDTGEGPLRVAAALAIAPDPSPTNASEST